MRDCRAIRRVPLRAFALQMNPLVILGNFSKAVDAFLCDRRPIGHGDFAADELFQTLWRFYDTYHELPLINAGRLGLPPFLKLDFCNRFGVDFIGAVGQAKRSDICPRGGQKRVLGNPGTPMRLDSPV